MAALFLRKVITIYWSMVDPDDQEMGSHLPNSVTL